ncbi:hypothetical protein JQM68_12710 [Oscillibacter valericigenes]|uniref:hypothetical protein n=1 Tax=Oscillibacter valericigenes TaxID=351091 RepID=UPI001F1679BE|nr:hypothetical protein [Oscillibacter valericigenes]MCF2618045.1 hypothetical protein [Oscillibacter valericigenes]
MNFYQNCGTNELHGIDRECLSTIIISRKKRKFPAHLLLLFPVENSKIWTKHIIRGREKTVWGGLRTKLAFHAKKPL